jgi:hypothetical protein
MQALGLKKKNRNLKVLFKSVMNYPDKEGVINEFMG